MFTIKKLKLVTSNENKLKEFKRFGLTNITIEKGRDIAEVESDANTVVLYKALDAGKGRIVEDTSLEVEGADVGVNVRWMLDNLTELSGRKAVWRVILGYNDGVQIHLYESTLEGELVDVEDVEESLGFGFDSIFKPNGTNYTLAQLEKLGKKDLFSARNNAVQNLLYNQESLTVNVTDLPKWEGKYQQED